MTSRMRLGEVFVQKEILTHTTVERMLTVSKQQNKRLGTVLAEVGLITDDELACAVAFQYGFDIVRRISDECPPQQVLDLIPWETARTHLMFPLKLSGSDLLVAVNDPTDVVALQAIADRHNLTYTLFVAPCREIMAAIERNYARHHTGGQLSKPRLLVVDDDPFMRTMLSEAFRSDFQVVTAEDGVQGYAESLRIQPQVIVTDLEMPGSDGFALLSMLQQADVTRAVPVVLMTGRSNPQDEAAALEKGFFDFVAKPFALPSFIARVRKALRYSGWPQPV